MASGWAQHLPVVSVPDGAAPKAVTLVYPYYESPDFFARQVAHWSRYPAALTEFVSAIVVDDGSRIPATVPDGLAFPLRLFRVDVDVRWNWLAARNIGAHHAADGWLLLTDMDHVVPAGTLSRLIHGEHNPNVVYAFSRTEHTGEPVAPHSASFFMTRKQFWRIGGYDERLSGLYGTDGQYRKRVAKLAPMQVLTDHLIRHEFVDDASTTRYGRKEPADTVALRSRLASIPADSAPLTLSFPYHEVTAC